MYLVILQTFNVKLFNFALIYLFLVVEEKSDAIKICSRKVHKNVFLHNNRNIETMKSSILEGV